jgi:uncharacterized membrane protein
MVCKVACIVLDLLELFWMHQNNELRMRLYLGKIFTHTGAFRSVTPVAFFSVTVVCLLLFHKRNYSTIFL